MEQDERINWREKVDGVVFEWTMPNKMWVKLQKATSTKIVLWYEWMRNRIKELIK